MTEVDLDTVLEDWQGSLDVLGADLRRLTSVALSDLLRGQPTPLDRAKAQTVLAYMINTLVFLLLKANGLSTADHPVKQELDRVRHYIKKIKTAEGVVERPTEKIDQEAANRFLKASLPDLRDAIGAAAEASRSHEGSSQKKSKKHKKKPSSSSSSSAMDTEPHKRKKHKAHVASES